MWRPMKLISNLNHVFSLSYHQIRDFFYTVPFLSPFHSNPLSSSFLSLISFFSFCELSFPSHSDLSLKNSMDVIGRFFKSFDIFVT